MRFFQKHLKAAGLIFTHMSFEKTPKNKKV